MENKKKNFTNLEKSLLLSILQKYKSIIENKKTDAVSSRLKKDTWERIALDYNRNSQINQTATGDQLKRLWANLKCRQREALTTERQHRMATGGGHPIQDVEVDPEISLITPALLVEVNDSQDSDSTTFQVEVLDESLLAECNEDNPTMIDNTHYNVGAIDTNSNSANNMQNLSDEQYKNNQMDKIKTENQLKCFILKKEYVARDTRASQIFALEKALLEHKIRKAKAEADLAEASLRGSQ